MISLQLNPIAFTLPLINHPITWYGICFATGLLLSFWQMRLWLRQRLHLLPNTPQWNELTRVMDRLLIWAMIGIVIGARSFEALFYSPHIFNSMEFFQTWNGGLSSHGGILGVALAIALFWLLNRKRPSFESLQLRLTLLLDCAGASSGLCAFMIRLGNFINQEILGLPTSMPWGIISEVPSDQIVQRGADILATQPVAINSLARHPVQLYEGFSYLAIWIYGSYRLRKKPELPGGAVCSEVLIAIFMARIALELFKAPVADQDHTSLLYMGQILSLPLLGGALIWRLALRRQAISFKPLKRP